MKRKATPDALALEILRELVADHRKFGDPLAAPTFDDVMHRACSKFRGEVPQEVWDHAVAILDEGHCLARAQGDNRMYVYVTDHGPHHLSAYEEEIRQRKPKTNWTALGVLIALAVLVFGVLKFVLLR